MRLIILTILLTACSPAWHLKQAEKHLKKAEIKGASAQIDTVFVDREVIVPEVRFDTVVREVNFTDTVVVTQNNVITKVKVNTVEREVYIKTVCPPDTVKIEVPVSVTKEIKTGYPLWWLAVAAICGVGIGFILMKVKE